MLPCEERIDRCKRKRKLIKISIGPSPDLYTFGQPSSLSIRRLPPLENVSIEMAQSVSSSPPATDITGLGENKSYGTMGIARSPLDDWSDGVELERKGPSSSSHVFCEDFAGQTCCCGESSKLKFSMFKRTMGLSSFLRKRTTEPKNSFVIGDLREGNDLITTVEQHDVIHPIRHCLGTVEVQ
ncbi:unnamed protein product [Victoria cruziana]